MKQQDGVFWQYLPNPEIGACGVAEKYSDL
jgi:hypothetical protein